MKIRLRESNDMLLFVNNSYPMVRDNITTDGKTTTIEATGLQWDNDNDNEKKR